MTHSSSTEPDDAPRSFRLSSGKCKNARVVHAVGIIWFLLSSFIASPFSELWGFYLSCVFISVVGLMLSRSKSQFITGGLLLMLSGVFCCMSFMSGR